MKSPALLQRGIWLILLVSLLLFALQTSAAPKRADDDGVQKSPALVWGYMHFPPRIYTDKQGKVAGELAVVMKTVLEQGGYTYRVVASPNRRMFHMLNSGSIDLMLIRADANIDKEAFLLSKASFGELVLQVYWLDGQATAVSQISQLSDQSVIVLSGYRYGGLLEDRQQVTGVNTLVVENHQRGFAALKLKRAPYLLDYQKPATIAIDALKLTNVRSYTVSRVTVNLMVRRQLPGAEALLRDLESRYQQHFPDIYTRYNSPPEP
ncbi:transporter substrate-binding domain-containing protein [Aestuariibacter halophilus]|uniref:Transporter substrate-binding domain-containing protein n=1 Tax=Fluctibacter halophilus TaxID=226011 RepID=A0ABS8G961_9ALTE|nr:transporter substrate-binding domain-containing protein [Aestuariibacter halophilus]MCC2617107.1 transporter substrate-binding domain-containing protein [Aestuariibacter halophilus]